MNTIQRVAGGGRVTSRRRIFCQSKGKNPCAGRHQPAAWGSGGLSVLLHKTGFGN